MPPLLLFLSFARWSLMRWLPGVECGAYLRGRSAGLCAVFTRPTGARATEVLKHLAVAAIAAVTLAGRCWVAGSLSQRRALSRGGKQARYRNRKTQQLTTRHMSPELMYPLQLVTQKAMRSSTPCYARRVACHTAACSPEQAAYEIPQGALHLRCWSQTQQQRG